MEAFKPSWVLSSDWDSFVSQCVPLSLAENQWIFRQNESLNHLFVLESGRLHIWQQDEWISVVDEPWSWFGELSFITGQPTTASVMAVAGSKIWKVPFEAIYQLDDRYQKRFINHLYQIWFQQLRSRLKKTNAIVQKLLEKQLVWIIRHLNQFPEQTSNSGAQFLKNLQIHFHSQNPRWNKLWEELQNRIKPIVSPALTSSRQLLLGDSPDPNPGLPFFWLVSQLPNPNQLPSHLTGLWIEDPEQNHLPSLWQQWVLILFYLCQNQPLSPSYHLLDYPQFHFKWEIQESRMRQELIDEMINQLSTLGIRQKVLSTLRYVAEEWLMNAFYDAPVNTNGQALYNHIHRSENVVLDRPVQLEVAGNDWQLTIMVTDPFGSLELNTIIRYFWKNHWQQETQETHKFGAGKGLFTSWQLLDQMWVRIQPGVNTQVLGLISLEKTLFSRLNPSGVFFKPLSD